MGDLILHLRGRDSAAQFVGWSVADADGYTTAERPPKPKKWAFAKSFNRVPLRDFVPLASPIPLRRVFSSRDAELRSYFLENSRRSPRHRRHIFFVIQSERLQCLNGAYLSELDSALRAIIITPNVMDRNSSETLTDVDTDQRLRHILTRIGQKEFSDAVKDNFGGRCCFPGCAIDDSRFLVGAHIARWADNPELRGSVANGVCFCLMHDKAFEIGLFTLSPNHAIRVNRVKATRGWARALSIGDGQRIALGPITPAREALECHWRRIGFDPIIAQ